MRIWHQGFVDFDHTPTYRASFARHLSQVMPPGVTEIAIHGLRPGTFSNGVAPIGAVRYPYVENLVSEQTCEAALLAEAGGYDAVAVNCFFDPALRRARSIVSIPIVSLFESCFIAAMSLGRSVGMLGLNEDVCRRHRELVAENGWSDRFTATIPVSPAIDEYLLEDDGDGAATIDASIVAACRLLADRGAEIIVPGDGVLNDFIWRRKLRVPDLTILDAAAVLFHHAAFLASLRERSGISVSRAGFYARPPEHVLAATRAFNLKPSLTETDFSGVGLVTPQRSLEKVESINDNS